MEIITYSLRDGQKQSEQYYRTVAAFTDAVLAEAELRLGDRVEAFQTHLRQVEPEAPRSPSETLFELLTLGVLWRVYAADVPDLAKTPQHLLTFLLELRRRNFLKPAIDFLRVGLGHLLLRPKRRHPSQSPTPTLARLDRLLNWLAASGDFSQEVKQLRRWQEFLAGQPTPEATAYLTAAISLAAWFEVRSEAVLGRYTPHVEQFLAQTHPGYRWREDAIFCGRRRVEYHLNMVGTEILNRAYRATFLRTARKIVLVPPCMTAQPDDLCQARPTALGSRCAGCTPGCRVHQLTKLGEKHHFDVLIMAHDLPVFSRRIGQKPLDAAPAGIVGISCVLTNSPGGWQARELGLPAQGVLLDYCGCRYHWHPQGFPTDINIGQLARVLDIARPGKRSDI